MTEDLSRRGLLHLGVVYVLWSTTYLAIRLGVHSGSGFPPFAFGGLRMVAAALILLGLARFQGSRIRPTRSELVPLLISGNLLWCGGNGLLAWAEQYAPSGFSSVMVSSAPIWATIVELVIYKKRPSAALVITLAIGFGGVAILSGSPFSGGASATVPVIAALVFSPLCWVLGSLFQARKSVGLAPQTMSGYHHLAGLLGFAAASVALGEPFPHPTASAWLAWAYLVVFASVGAFTSYVVALRLLPVSIVMTYAYVNPVLALALGWWVLDEPVTLRTLFGAALVVLSVGVIFHVRQSAADARHGITPGEGDRPK